MLPVDEVASIRFKWALPNLEGVLCWKIEEGVRAFHNPPNKTWMIPQGGVHELAGTASIVTYAANNNNDCVTGCIPAKAAPGL
ncbi:hypothetical protein HCH_00994 [Hahella chejuensis KCTC 2396]|uniref:Uncharacterized protein n=1 Tax=Hahella chejuensis (strain KCTC 2396) TaxID=349521 RepID=Q2SN95_HAHCH|nr:hypothetical protein HCH_00994 [Hahella chejuensis KCTC 2396]